MQNALGEVQTVLLLGGTSEIGRAIVDRLVTPQTTDVVLAARDPARVDTAGLESSGRTVDVVPFDAADTGSHRELVAGIVERHGDLDVVVVAFGQLGDQEQLADDPEAAATLVHVNYTGAVSVVTAVASQFRRQGHGRLVVLSSVAGERVRRANYVYGSSKAGLDGFAQGLGDALSGSGASVLVVRPGWVTSKMTSGLTPAPLATTPAAVADATVRALQNGRRIVWVPPALRYIFIVFRHMPGWLWRRMPR
jgi:decaprenylphospho-beta-D-erythro-pentofuranosid-2-ulose 2-reductase